MINLLYERLFKKIQITNNFPAKAFCDIADTFHQRFVIDKRIDVFKDEIIPSLKHCHTPVNAIEFWLVFYHYIQACKKTNEQTWDFETLVGLAIDQNNLFHASWWDAA